MNRLQAFTLFEMMIVMVLTSIMFAITYTAYRSVSYVSGLQSRAGSSIATVRMIDGALRRDVDRAQAIHEFREGILDFITPDGSIRYTFLSKRVLRSLPTGQLDTFDIATRGASLSLGYHDYSEGIVDHISLDVIAGDSKISLSYEKEYSASIRINNYIDSISSELH